MWFIYEPFCSFRCLPSSLWFISGSRKALRAIYGAFRLALCALAGVDGGAVRCLNCSLGLSAARRVGFAESGLKAAFAVLGLITKLRGFAIEHQDALGVLPPCVADADLKRMPFADLRQNKFVTMCAVALQAEKRLHLILMLGLAVSAGEAIPQTDRALSKAVTSARTASVCGGLSDRENRYWPPRALADRLCFLHRPENRLQNEAANLVHFEVTKLRF